jgi:CheY-like chemotaxis protein
MTVFHDPSAGSSRWRTSVLLCASEGSPMSDEANEVESSYRGNGEHILLVDHAVLIIQTGERLIEQLGYRVTTCTSSGKALSLIHSTAEVPIDCVICELDMPDIGGVAIANTCRLCRPKTGFLLSSAIPGVLSAESLRILGVADLVTKPFSAYYLAKALNRALTGYKS